MMMVVVTVLTLGSILEKIPLHYRQKTRILRTESSELLSVISCKTVVEQREEHDFLREMRRR